MTASRQRTRARADDDSLLFLAWNDLVGITRGRGILRRSYAVRRKTGINWAMAGQALTPFEDIADNPWGPLDEAHMTPAPETEIKVDVDGSPPLNMVLCDGLTAAGDIWDSCTRGFCKAAVDDLRREVGLHIIASPELEFQLIGGDLPPATPFSLEAFRLLPDLGERIVAALRQANTEPETFEPEYGVGQYEVSCRPTAGVAAADRMVVVKEVIREIARRRGYRASFTPKPLLGRPGNGAHIHFSLQTTSGKRVTHDPQQPGELSRKAAQFAAGIVRHLPALCALTAPSVPSYYRLGPHHWSSGYACIGISNREAAVRICLPPKGTADSQRRLYNLEFRPADGAASPYLALGALIRAGLAGIREQLPLPPLLEEDPHDIGPAKRRELGVVELPSTLGAALDCLERDDVAKSWFAPNLWRTYLAVKRKEIAMMTTLSEEAVCERYRNAY